MYAVYGWCGNPVTVPEGLPEGHARRGYSEGQTQEGRVLTYNRWEEELAGRRREQTLGKLFFSEVAPCMGVAEFEGRFRAMVDRDETAQEELDFVFRFPGAERLVNISLTWAPRWQRGFILVRTFD